MSMSVGSDSGQEKVMSEINTTPLVDVMLVMADHLPDHDPCDRAVGEGGVARTRNLATQTSRKTFRSRSMPRATSTGATGRSRAKTCSMRRQSQPGGECSGPVAACGAHEGRPQRALRARGRACSIPSRPLESSKCSF